MILFRLAPLAAVALLAAGPASSGPDLPEGPGRAVLQTVCFQCHGPRVVFSEPRSEEAWTEVVSRMVGSGAQLTDEEYQLVIDYLTANFGPSSRGEAPGAGHGGRPGA